MAAPKKANPKRTPGAAARKRGSSKVSNATIAGLLRRYANVIALYGENRFKVKAHRRAPETIESS
jgi:hypothetical protein